MPATSEIRPKPAVALVCPPYGPDIYPNLGLANLSAGVKLQGFECRTFYWNLSFREHVREHGLDYNQLSTGYLFPLNEWIFAREVFPAGEDPRGVVEKHLAGYGRWVRRPRRARSLSLFPTPVSERILGLREHSAESLQVLVDELQSFDIVGISTSFFQNLASLALAKRLKERWPEKTVVLGGSNCEDEMGSALLEYFGFLDYVFTGESDFVFPEFVRRHWCGESVQDLEGIVWRDARGQVRIGPTPEPLQRLDDLPYPDFDDYVAQRASFPGGDEKPLLLPLESSRGCWWGAKHHCTFCGLNGNGMVFRQKSQKRFEAEVEAMVDRYRTKFIFMTDLILSMSYFREFMDWSAARKLQVDFFYETKANLRRDQVEKLGDAGITRIQPGIESFSSKTLQLMRKGVKGIQNIALLKYLAENGVLASYGLLGGFPGEDPEEFRAMAKRMRKLVHLQPPRSLGQIRFHRFSPYHQDPSSFGIRLRPSRKYEDLYPLEQSKIARLAYHFEREDEPVFPHHAEVQQALFLWRSSYTMREVLMGDGCSLKSRRRGRDIVVRDRRPGFPMFDYVLTDYAAAVFRAIDQPARLQSIAPDAVVTEPPEPAPSASGVVRNGSDGRVRSLFSAIVRWGAGTWLSVFRKARVVSFTRQEFEQNAAACLQPLVAAGLVDVEDGYYLALPVAETPRHHYAPWPGEVAHLGFSARARVLATYAFLRFRHWAWR